MVDGVYDRDPNIDPQAEKYDEISFDEVLTKNLGIMDATAIALCRDNDIPVIVFNISDPENIYLLAKGENVGTVIS